MADSHAAGAHGSDVTRRDFLEYAAAGGAAIFGAAIAADLVLSMNPAKDVLALSSVEVDLKSIQPGQGIVVSWQGKPIFIRHRTKEEIAAAQAAKAGEMPDPQGTDLRPRIAPVAAASIHGWSRSYKAPREAGHLLQCKTTDVP